jgi:three-Cys-motif partner protein
MDGQKIPWLEKHLRLITLGDDAQNLIEMGGGICASIRAWSLLKLASLRYLGSMYTRVMKRCIEKGYFNRMYYVDFFSGPGINKIENTNVFCFGSPLIINTFDKERQFSKMLLNDADKNNKKALESRLTQIAQTEYVVKDDDANLFVEKIASEISEKKCHSLIFIDPYSTEFSWKSMESVLGLNADLFFLFQTSQMPRGIPVTTRPDAKIRSFFKDYEEVSEICREDSMPDKASIVLEIYKKDVQETKGPETLLESIRIGKGNFYYDMLFVTKKTQGGNPWFKAVMDLKRRIESYDNESVEQTLEIISGTQTQLSRWY